MLIRADPQTKTISLLSFPRDLDVPIYCPRDGHAGHVARPTGSTRRTRAAARRARSLTVKHLTGLPINYLITVNFHGFKEVVDKLGGVWMDVDRRYYNQNTGAVLQRLREHQPAAGLPAAERRSRRSTSSASGTPTPTSTALARQQEFVRAFKEQVAHNFSYTQHPEPRQHDHEEHRGRARAATRCSATR